MMRCLIVPLLFTVSHVCWAAEPAEPMRTFDGLHDIRRVHVTMVYFVPRDRTPLPDWRDRLEYFRRRIEAFHAREFGGQSQLTATIYEKPLLSGRDCSQLRNGDRDFIFFQTLGEVESRLEFGPRADGAYPILLVLSDINWAELDDFYRLRAVDGQFEGQFIAGRHFPGAASGGARATYIPQRGVGWGLVSADGWRVPYTGSDCVVYHEGVGHPIGLPHPEPGDDSVMSLAQYRFWLNESWVDEDQKRKLGWVPPQDRGKAKDDLFSRFTATAEPAVPQPGQEVALRFTWPAEARVRQCTVQLQTELFGAWHTVPGIPQNGAPAAAPMGSFDRPTPVSYRVTATLDDGQAVELWGYFQVRVNSETPPSPSGVALADIAPPQPRWDETLDLLSLVDPARDTVSGKWSLNDGRLESNKQYGARIELPFQPPEEYVLTAVVEPLDEPNGLILGQRSGDHRFLVLVNYRRPDQPPASALENVDGRNVDLNGTTVHGPFLPRNQPSVVVCTVRKESVTVSCDGRQIIDFKGDAARFSLSDYWQTPHSNSLFVGAYDCAYRFHRVTLTPITGDGQRLAVGEPN